MTHPVLAGHPAARLAVQRERAGQAVVAGRLGRRCCRWPTCGGDEELAKVGGERYATGG